MKRNLTLLAALLAVTLTLGIGPAAAGSWTWGAAPAAAAIDGSFIAEADTVLNAETGLPDRGQRRSLVGEIAGKTADSFVLKRRTGQTDTIMVTRTTSYRERNRRTTFAALQPGMRVSVMARQSEGVTTAVIVEVMQAVRDQPKRSVEQHLGTITATSATSVTVRGRSDAQDHTAVITPTTRILPARTTLQVGDTVIVVYRTNAAGDGMEAVSITKLTSRTTAPPVRATPTPGPTS